MLSEINLREDETVMSRSCARRRPALLLVLVAAVSVALSLLPAAPGWAGSPKEKVVFTDHFSDTGWNVGTFPHGSIAYEHGGLRLTLDSPNSIVFAAGPIPRRYGSVAIETDFSTPDANAYPLVHCKGSGLLSDYGGPHYELTVRPDLIGVAKFGPGGTDATGIAGGPAAARPELFEPAGKPNHLRFECVDHAGAIDFRVLLNGKLALDGTDADHPLQGGAVGVAAVSRDAAGSVLFDDFVLRDPSGGKTEPKPLHGTKVAKADGPVLYQDDLTVAKPDEGFQAATIELPKGTTTATFTHDAYEVKPAPGAIFAYTADSVDNAVKGGRTSSTTDVEVTASKRSGGNAHYGVVCDQAPGASTAYFLGIDNDGFGAIVASRDGQFRPLVTTPARLAGVKPGAARNVVRATCAHNADGVHLSLAVNGKAVLETTDTAPLAPGSVGVYVESIAGATSTVRFQHFTARGSENGQ